MRNKHAFLIGAYGWPDYLKQLVDSLDSERSNFYIHINKENAKEFSGFIEEMKLRDNIYISTDIRVKWGGYTFFQSIQVLYKEALKNNENIYFHLITGSDVLIKPLSQLFKFFDCTDKSYIYSFSNPSKYNDRYAHYHFFDIINYRGNILAKCFEYSMNIIQKLLHIKRKPLPFKQLFVGYPWFSIKRDDMQYINDFIDKNIPASRLNMTCAPDEMLIQSVLLNNAEHSRHVVNDNLRKIVWGRYPGGQKTFTIDDYSELMSTNAFFARKIHPHKSKKLLDALELYRNH